MSNYKPSVGVQGGLKPLGDFPIAHAKDIEMPDGTSLSEFAAGGSGYPAVSAPSTGITLEPNTYYVFGTVDSLTLSFHEPADGKLHEFAFEFTPSSSFSGLTFANGSVQWANEQYYIAGKAVQVSIVRGIGVSVSAL